MTRALVGSSLLLGGFAFVAQPASADHLACGATVTQNVTLDSDIGPCTGDGLVVATSNVTINLNGFRIFADNGAGDNAGIRIRPGAAGLTTGVTIIRGTVEGFDAGIGIFGGGNNLVRNMTIQNNINDQIPTVPAGGDNPCDLGDGIAMLNSSDNDIINNRLVRNGPLGGITAIENSDRNYIAGNTLADHNLRGVPGGGCGNANQNEGVRIEGPGANDNIVENNTVTNSGLAGIGLHGYVC
ncbi:MAG: right-handed parallel beta-helix repeat-containing protein, partial [Acidimicrobiales bacterium]